MRRFLQRNIVTGIKLPFAMAWDVISLGNMGDEASTSKVLREHRDRAAFDDRLDAMEELRAAAKDWK